MTPMRGIMRRYWIVAAVLLIGIAASLASFALLRHANLKHHATELQSQVDLRLRTLQETFTHGVVLVADLQGYVGASAANRGRQQFGTLADHLVKMHNGLQALSWIPRVSSAERESFEASVRNEGLRDFHIVERGADGRPVTAGARDEYFPITVAEPAAGNAAVLGYDLGSDPARREVLERARDTGSPAASTPVQILRDTAKRMAVLIVGPVYRHVLSDTTVDERRADLAGFVAGVFRVADVVESNLLDIANADGETHGFDDYIFDGDQPRSDRLIYVHASRLRAVGDSPPPFDRVPEAYLWIHKIEIADRHWTVLTASSPKLSPYPLQTNEWASLFGGFLLAAFAAQYVVLTTRRSGRLRQLTNNLMLKTKQLEREIDERKRIEERLEMAAAIVEQSPVILSQWRITGKTPFEPGNFIPEYISENVSQFGYTAKDITTGKVDFFQQIPVEDRPRMLASLQALVAENRTEAQNIFRIAKPDGEICWVEGNLVVQRDDAGRPIRGLGTLRDITERKRFEDKLEFSAALLTTAFESAQDGILVVDENAHILSFNHRFAEIWELPPDLVAAGEDESVMRAAASRAKDEQGVLANVKALYAHPEVIGHDEIELKNGRTVEAYSKAMRDPKGRYLGRISIFHDITEKKKETAEREFANTLLTTEMESSLDGVLVVDANAKIILFNKRFVELWQVPMEITEAGIDEPVLQTVAEQVRDRNGFLARARYLYAHPEETSHEEIELKDGRVFDRHSAPLSEKAGKYLGRVWFFRDITERKRAALALADSERKFRTILETVVDGIIVAEAETGKVVVGNRAICEMLGYRPEELAALAVADLHPPEALPAVRREFERVRKGEVRVAGDLPVKRKDGSVFVAAISGSAMAFEGRNCVVGVFRDVTERLRAEESLRVSEEKLRTLIESTSDYIWEADTESRYTYMSGRVVEVLGYEPAELIGVSPLALVPPSDAERIAAEFGQYVKDNKKLPGIRHPMIRKDGTIAIIETNGMPIFDPDGDCIGYRGIDRDVTASVLQEQLFEHRFRIALDVMPVAVTWARLSDGKVEFTNRKFVEMFGYNVGDLTTAEEWLERAYPVKEQRERAETEWLKFFGKAASAESEIGQFEIDVRCEDGSIKSTLHGGVILPIAGWALSIFVDISERKKAAADLEFANTLLRTEIENTSDGILVVDENRKVTMFNRKFRELWRLPKDIVAAEMDDAVFRNGAMQLEDPAGFYARIMYLYEHPYEVMREDIEFKDGRVFDGHSAPLHGPDGKYLGRLWDFHDVTDRRKYEETLKQERDFSAVLFDSAPGLLFLLDANGHYVRVNTNLAQLFSLQPEEMVGKNSLLSVLDEDREQTVRDMQAVAERGLAESETRLISKSGEPRTFRITGRRIDIQHIPHILVAGIDVTEARQAEQRLRESEQQLRLASRIVDNSPTILFRVKREEGWPLSYVSENVSRYGYKAGDLCAAAINVVSIIHPDDVPRVLNDISEAITAGRNEFEMDARLRAGDGNYVWLNLKLTTMRDSSGNVTGLEGMGVDITERRAAEERMSVMARRDGLTGLANRAVFVEAVDREVARMRRDGGSFAVLYLDLDHFKDVNDTLGHPVGDLLLQAVAERMKTCIREVDTVARFGGDEFAVLETNVLDPADAAALAEKLIDVIGKPYSLAGNELRIGTSIGIDVFGPESTDAETLLSHGDVALYRAKAEGRHTYRFFTEVMNQEVRKRVQVQNELREAIETNQLFLVYQPQVELKTGRIIGVEALVRWRHPKRGVVPPLEFIPVAEKTGLIVPLGKWVLGEAIRQAKKWYDAGLTVPITGINVSNVQFTTGINIYGHQFSGAGALEDDLASLIKETGLPPGMIELEITESTLMETSRENSQTLARIRKSGIRIAIDDFGTGYSSLDYLRKLPVDRVKVAQEFVIGLKAGSGDAVIVKAAIGLARALGLRVIAEGVETAEQLELLKEWGCPEGQGFYFARPMPAEAVEPLLRAGKIIPKKPAALRRAM